MRAGSNENLGQDLSKLEQEWLDAEDDPSALESILADDFVHVLPAGFVTKREQPNYLRNNATAKHATVLLAEKMVSHIYEEAGLSTIWKNCVAQPELERERCIETVDNRHFVLQIEHQPRTLETDIYGVAFLGEDGSGSYCDIFYDRIAELHHRGRASQATILGIVAAHELGHLLLGSHAHSSIGIMRPQLQEKDFWAPELGATTLSRQQTQTISDRLVRNTSGKGLEIARRGF